MAPSFSRTKTPTPSEICDELHRKRLVAQWVDEHRSTPSIKVSLFAYCLELLYAARNDTGERYKVRPKAKR